MQSHPVPATAMAAAPVKQRTAASRAQLPPCYYEGYLEKRGAKEKVSIVSTAYHVGFKAAFPGLQ